MSTDRHHAGGLRDALAAAGNGAVPTAGCLGPARIYDAAGGAGTAADRKAVIAHVARCPRCGEAWELAVAMHREAGDAPFYQAPAAQPEARVESPPRHRTWMIAATVALAAGAILFLRARQVEPPYRSASQQEIRSRVPADQTLEAAPFELRWSPIRGASRYAVRLFGADLNPLYEVKGLVQPSCTVPEGVFAEQAVGTTIRWQVEARGAEGEIVAISPVFSAVLR